MKKNNRGLTINEIAQLAGVSRATVSRYLNDGYVSEEKKEQIKRVIEETGYQPSPQAQTLRTNKTRLIGVVLPKIHSETVSRMVAGISDALREEGYHILLANTNNEIEEELKYLEIFKENYADGIIFIATIFTGKHKKLLKEIRKPLVLLGQRLDGYSSVYHDDYHAAADMARLLVKDIKKPAFIGVTDRDEAVGKMRKNGFLKAVKEKGLECPEIRMGFGDFTMEAGYEKMKEIMTADPETDAVFCVTDTIASGAMLYLEEIGKRVPEDIRVSGFDDTKISMLTKPKLATVHLHYKTCGQEAAKMLLEALKNSHAAVKELKMGYEIKENGSLR